jgi:hypothetical protein
VSVGGNQANDEQPKTLPTMNTTTTTLKIADAIAAVDRSHVLWDAYTVARADADIARAVAAHAVARADAAHAAFIAAQVAASRATAPFTAAEFDDAAFDEACAAFDEARTA